MTSLTQCGWWHLNMTWLTHSQTDTAFYSYGWNHLKLKWTSFFCNGNVSGQDPRCKLHFAINFLRDTFTWRKVNNGRMPSFYFLAHVHQDIVWELTYFSSSFLLLQLIFRLRCMGIPGQTSIWLRWQTRYQGRGSVGWVSTSDIKLPSSIWLAHKKISLQ